MEVGFKKVHFRRLTEKRSISNENYEDSGEGFVSLQSFRLLSRMINYKVNEKSDIYNSACQVFKNEVGASHVEMFLYKKGKLVTYAGENGKIVMDVDIYSDVQSYCVISKEKIVVEHPNTSSLPMKFMNSSSVFSPLYKKDLHVVNFASIPIYVTYN